MENFLLCDELQSLRDCPLGHLTCPALLYKGRRKGTVEFVGIWKHNKLDKKYIENGVRSLVYTLWMICRWSSGHQKLSFNTLSYHYHSGSISSPYKHHHHSVCQDLVIVARQQVS